MEEWEIDLFIFIFKVGVIAIFILLGIVITYLGTKHDKKKSKNMKPNDFYKNSVNMGRQDENDK